MSCINAMSLYCGQIAEIELKVEELRQKERDRPDMLNTRKYKDSAQVRLDCVSYEGASLAVNNSTQVFILMHVYNVLVR